MDETNAVLVAILYDCLYAVHFLVALPIESEQAKARGVAIAVMNHLCSSLVSLLLRAVRADNL